MWIEERTLQKMSTGTLQVASVARPNIGASKGEPSQLTCAE